MIIIKHPFFKKTATYTLTFLTAIIILAVLFFLAVYFGLFGPLPTTSKLKDIKNEEASLVYSSDAKLIGKYFAENRTNITWEEVPEHLKNALVATEDKRFFEHNGYDTQSYLRVFFKTIVMQDNSGGGGSTLTQQLIKNLYGRSSFGVLSLPVNKIKEIIIASRIEAIYNKEELLLLYLNSVPFGENVYGIETAAHRYFNKATTNLTVEEAAVLVGMLKANTYYNPRLNPKNSFKRRNTVLKLMKNENYLTKLALDSIQKIPLKLNYENIAADAPAGYFIYQVKKKTSEILEEITINTGEKYNLEKDGLKIYTTLDMQLQELANKAVSNHLSKMQKLLDNELSSRRVKKNWFIAQQKITSKSDEVKRNVEILDWDGLHTKNISRLDSIWHYYKMLHAAVLITNPKNGAVLTYIGGNNFNKLPFDMVLSHRQIASAYKPILYATAIENGYTADTYLENIEKEYEDYDNWKPQNFDHKFTKDSTVALWYALAHSMNLPTVDLYFKVGREQLINTNNKLKFPSIKDNAPSMALGTLDVSLSEIVKAYGAFANNGKMNDLITITKITNAKGTTIYENKAITAETIFSELTANTITAILQKAVNEGTGTRLRNQYGIKSNIAGKTGTAQNYSNAWFMSYTPNLVVGTWVGASSPNVHFYSGKGSGSSLALPITAQIIKGIEGSKELNSKYLTNFNIPEDIYTTLETDPYREIGIDGFIKRLFQKKEKETFFDRLFKRKKRDKLQ